MVDLQARGVEFARRLGSLISFLEAAQELQACRSFSTVYFRRHSKKIVTLIEIARKTLTTAGIQVYLFSPCPATLVLQKSAYVDLLHMLYERRVDTDPVLEERVKKLLSPLSSGFQIIGRGESPPSSSLCVTSSTKTHASSELGPAMPDAAIPSVISAVPIPPMPPPDAFPVASSINSRRVERLLPKQPRRYWNAESLPSRSCRSRTSGKKPDAKADEEQENVLPPARLYRPLPRRFGIFCTGKSSMHQYRQSSHGRPRTAQ